GHCRGSGFGRQHPRAAGSATGSLIISRGHLPGRRAGGLITRAEALAAVPTHPTPVRGDAMRPFAPPSRPRGAVPFGLLAAALCVLSPSPAAADEALDPAALKRAKSATVRLKVTLPDNSVVQGSGFVIGSNLIVTNAHVLGMLRDE